MNIANIITARFDRWRAHMSKILGRHQFYMTVDDVYRQCSNCQKLFFDNEEAFVVINVIEHPKDIYLHVMLAGGTMKGLDELDAIIYKFGQQIGATKATFIGRKGFAKILAKRGWTAPHIYMEKEII